MEKDIFKRIEEASKPDFGQILTRSFEFVPKVWQVAIKHALLIAVIMVPLFLLIYIPFIAIYVEALDSGGRYYGPDYSTTAVVIYVIVVFILAFLGQLVTISVTSHFYRVLKNIDLGLNEDVGGYFDLLRQDFSKVFLLALATLGISLLAVSLCILPIYYVMVPLQLLVPLLTFNRELSVSEVLKAAFKLGNKHWIIVFGLVWLSSIIAQIGILICLVGIIFTAYFVHLTIYYYYKDTIGFDKN